jgi:hypothetical protein
VQRLLSHIICSGLSLRKHELHKHKLKQQESFSGFRRAPDYINMLVATRPDGVAPTRHMTEMQTFTSAQREHRSQGWGSSTVKSIQHSSVTKYKDPAHTITLQATSNNRVLAFSKASHGGSMIHPSPTFVWEETLTKLLDIIIRIPMKMIQRFHIFIYIQDLCPTSVHNMQNAVPVSSRVSPTPWQPSPLVAR